MNWIIHIEFVHQREKAVQIISIFDLTMEIFDFQNHVIEHTNNEAENTISK